ncbi:MAG TPA: DUF3164 family protein [Azospirillum sp.]|nr:DUF3164 family protein [Azospirillum sp.]
MSETTTTEIPTGAFELQGKLYMRDAKGHLVPLELVKPVDQLEDQMVRKIIGFAEELSAQIARFKGHTADDIGAFQALIAEQYGVEPKGGTKGNVTFTAYDGTLKVQVQIADDLTFGPQLQVAKQLIDECIAEWAAEANAPIRALVNHAFQVDKEGRVNRNAILQLRRVAIEDERWKKAMEAITDSIRVQGSKSYIRFYRRPSANAEWTAITIDLAAAKAPVRAEVVEAMAAE